MNIGNFTTSKDKKRAGEIEGRIFGLGFDIAAVVFQPVQSKTGNGPDYIVDHYRQLRELVLRVAEDGRGLIMYIN